MENSRIIESIEITGLYDRYNMKHEFFDGVNILYGKNGTGKTTLLHILANILNEDYSRFVFLTFGEIRVRMNKNREIILSSHNTEDNVEVSVKVAGEKKRKYSLSDISTIENNEYDMLNKRLRGEVPMWEEDGEKLDAFSAAYFPAFRALLEAWSLSEGKTSRSSMNRAFLRSNSGRLTDRLRIITKMSRELFGNFVPSITYPSLLGLQEDLSDKVNEALFRISRVDNLLISNAFLDIFKTLTASTQTGNENNEANCCEIIEEIKKYADQLEEHSVFTKLSNILEPGTYSNDPTSQHILSVYLDSLKMRAKTKDEAFREIETYLNSVNKFLETKKIKAAKVRGKMRNPIFLEYTDGSHTDLLPLSSGERQIVTMIYAATRMNQQKVILIDEPEISLHPDWQRRLIPSMLEQLGNRQIIVCTHSPIIGANYDEHMNELALMPYVKTEKRRSAPKPSFLEDFN